MAKKPKLHTITKVCNKCKKRKNKEEGFYKCPTHADGFKHYCKKCCVKQSTACRLKNYDLYAERSKEYRQANVDRIFDYQQVYYANPDIKKKVAAWQKAYKKRKANKLAKYYKEYSKKNREIIAKKALAYYHKHKQAIAARRKALKK